MLSRCLKRRGGQLSKDGKIRGIRQMWMKIKNNHHNKKQTFGRTLKECVLCAVESALIPQDPMNE